MDNEHTIIAYMRISNEDKNTGSKVKPESNSISNQRLLIREFINSHDDLKCCRVIELLDDGYSGTNFDRPGISEALELIRQRKAHCLIVKDLSRFGRNYIDVGKYLEQLFPFLGVRFIAVNDGYDSSDPACVGSMATVFKTMFASLYSKDLSLKVKSAKYRLAGQGKYINSYAPYGYVKSAEDSKRLVIDREAAEVVKWIFHSFVKGKSQSQIARDLNDQSVLTPMQYKGQSGSAQSWLNRARNENNFWTDRTVSTILKDERYVGRVVYGKTRCVAVGSKKMMRVPKSQWITADGMHEGIIPPWLFEQAQDLIGAWRVEGKNPKSLLDKKMYCGVCNRRLTLVRGKKPYYYCDTHRFTKAFSCQHTKIYAEDVRDAVLASVRSQAQLVVHAQKILEIKYLGMEAERKAKADEVKRCEAAITRWEQRQKELFQAYFTKQIDKDIFVKENAVCTSKREEQTEKRKLLQEELRILQDKHKNDQSLFQNIKPYRFPVELDDSLIEELLDEIRVYDNNTIEVFWRFKDEMDLMIHNIAIWRP